MEELVARVAAAASITPELAKQAIAVIFAFLKKEAPAERVAEVFAAIPGADEAATAGEQVGGGGMFGGLMGMLGGGGGIMGVAAKLTGLGLGMGEMQAVGHALFAAVRDQAGEDKMREIAAAIPGLSQLLD